MTVSFAELDELRQWASVYQQAGVAPAPAQVADVLNAYRAMATNHPIFRRYCQHLQSDHARNTQPWHAEGERYLALLLALGAAAGEVGIDPTSLPGGALQAGGGMAFRLLLAVPYLWSNAIDELVIQSPPLPPHVISRSVLPYPYMFWSRETNFEMVHDGLVHETNWCLVTDEGSAMSCWVDDICQMGQGREPTMALRGGAVEYGKRFPDDFTPAERPSVESLLKRLAFLNSPYIGAERAHLGRPIRRELQRAGERDPAKLDPELYVVVLRREATHPTAPHPDRLEGPEWKHHWWVSGHYRAQWYASEQAHHVIWVQPYLKGDLGKPLLQRVYHVAR